MRLHLRVTPSEGSPYTVTTNVGVIVEWEDKFKTKMSNLAQSAGMRDFAYMAYLSARKDGIDVGPSFEKWCATLDSVELSDEDDARPLGRAPSAG